MRNIIILNDSVTLSEFKDFAQTQNWKTASDAQRGFEQMRTLCWKSSEEGVVIWHENHVLGVRFLIIDNDPRAAKILAVFSGTSIEELKNQLDGADPVLALRAINKLYFLKQDSELNLTPVFREYLLSHVVHPNLGLQQNACFIAFQNMSLPEVAEAIKLGCEESQMKDRWKRFANVLDYLNNQQPQETAKLGRKSRRNKQK